MAVVLLWNVSPSRVLHIMRVIRFSSRFFFFSSKEPLCPLMIIIMAAVLLRNLCSLDIIFGGSFTN